MEYLWQKIIYSATNNSIVLINSLFVLFIGILVSLWIKKLIILFLNRIRFNSLLDEIELNSFFKQIDINFNIIYFMASLIQTFFIILFLMLSSEIIGLNVFSELLKTIIFYYPNIFISLLIFILAIYAISLSQKIVVGTKVFQKITYSHLLGTTVDWSIRILAGLAILYQLGIIPQLILILFAGVVLTASLAVGLSLGLATREPVARMLRQIGKAIKKTSL